MNKSKAHEARFQSRWLASGAIGTMIDAKVKSWPSFWYSTWEGIVNAIQTLEGFDRLVTERRQAGYVRKERMPEFFIYLRPYLWLLDTCGNTCRATTDPVLDDDVPQVFRRGGSVSKRVFGGQYLSFSLTDSGIPTIGAVCPECGKGWDIRNCGDMVVSHTTEVLPIGFFAGRSLREVHAYFRLRKGVVRGMQSDILVRNDRYIDLSPEYPNPEADWQKNILKNERGWKGKREDVTFDYRVQPGDEGFFNRWSFFHHSCNRKYLDRQEEQSFRDVLMRAGYGDVEMAPIPNGYCPCDKCAAWFLVAIPQGLLKIGWRKRVINIDWSGTGKSLPDLFKGENVTSGDFYVHAWGFDKAVEYLGRLRQAL